MLTFHRAKFRDVLFHGSHLFVDIIKLFPVRCDDIRSIGLRPTNQYRIRVFKRRALRSGSNAVFDLYKKHITDDAQSFGCQSQPKHWIIQVRIPRVLVVLYVFLHGFVVHTLTCPVP